MNELAYGFVAGAIATLNPCGFAMLPAVLARFITRPGGKHPVLEGLSLGGLLTLGTLTAFTALGLVFSLLGTGLTRFIPQLGLILGVLLLALSVPTLVGRPPELRLTRLRAPRGSRLLEFYPFGVAYGLASLGCALPIFLSLLIGVTHDPATGVMSFVGYGLGMGAVLTGVSLAAAFGKDALLRWMRQATRFITLAGGLGLLGAGAYLVDYQLRALEGFSGGSPSGLPFVAALSLAVIAVLASRAFSALERAKRGE